VAFCGVNDFTEDMLQADPLITGVVEEPDIRGTLDLMIRLHPRTDRVLVICDETATGRQNTAIARRTARDYAGDIEFEYLYGGDLFLTEVLSRVASAGDNTLVLLLEFFYDKRGVYLEPLPTAEAICEASARPVYTHADIFVGHGPVGGQVTSGRMGGRYAAQMARRILAGTKVSDIPIQRESPTVRMFDADQLERFDIPVDSLPADAIILNRQLTFYERYKRMVWSILLIVAGLSATVIVLLVNIASRRRAQRELLQQRGLLHHIIDNIPHAVWWKDIHGRYLGANREFARQIHLPDADVAAGRTSSELVSLSDDGGEHLMRVEECMKTPAEQVTGRELVVGEDNNQQTYIVGKLSLRDEKGQVRGMVGLASDVTRRVRLERELGQSRKMEAIGQLAGGVAHDFNNLLTVIGGNAQLLLADQSPPEEWRELSREIQEASTRASDLTRQLLTFARRGPMETRGVDMRGVVNETVRLLQRSIEKRIEIRTHIEASEPLVVRGDATRLQSAILNLALNARDAIPAAGTITIELAGAELTHEDIAGENLDVDPGSYVRLRVSDTGEGMDAETVSRIFDPFFTTKQRGSGTGLGLSVVYGTVKSHKGAVTVRSTPGEGTTFDLVLPRAHQQPEVGTTAGNELPTGHGVILVVDDEPTVLNYASRALRGLGYEVEAFESATEAVKALRADPDRFDLALIDVVMPQMGGPELTRIARRLSPDLAVIWISGFSEEAVEGMAHGHKAPALLSKPFTVEQLARMVADQIPVARR
jgi:PAS domain S-box-containing protein